MEEIKNILFVTDFSDTSENAYAFALEIASRCQSKLSLLHVYEVPNVAPVNVFTTLDETFTAIGEEMKSQSEETLKAMKQRTVAYGIKCEVFSKEGDVNDQIVSMVGEQTDLLIMGTKGKNTDRGLFIGSTANAMIRAASCPVLCVPQEASLKDIRKIAYATNLNYDETVIIRFLVNLAKVFDAEVILVHVDQDSENEEWSVEMLKDLIAKTDYTKIYFREFVTDDILEGINNFVTEYGIDVISTTSYNTSFFERLFKKSQTKQVLMHTKIPLLAFNRKSNATFFL